LAISAKSKQPKANTGFIKMDWITILGLIAATLTTGSFIPQAVKVVQTKSTKDLSLGMFVILTAGIVLWLAYGIFIGMSAYRILGLENGYGFWLWILLSLAVSVFLTGFMLKIGLKKIQRLEAV